MSFQDEPRFRISATERFLSFVKISESNCWEWIGGKARGYGKFWYKPKKVHAHRFIYEYFYGKINSVLEIDHLCKNRACVNPVHLEAVTKKENLRRGNHNNQNKGKTHCKNGHKFTPENTYKIKEKCNRSEYRQCKICQIQTKKRWELKQKLLEVIPLV